MDSNVPIVANGNPDSEGKTPSIDCRILTITFLKTTLESGKMLVDLAGYIQKEYSRYLNPRGQPGVGDRFYQEVLNSAPRLIERIELLKREDGEYANLPQAVINIGFDPSDRKFAALANREHVPVVNATDSDWVEHHETLSGSGIRVVLLCGCDTTKWFVT